MRASVKDSIAVFTPQGFIDGTNAPLLLTVEDINVTKKLKVNMVLISLKKVLFFNINGIHTLVRYLEEFKKDMSISIGFCDYDKAKYEQILGFYDYHINFSMYKTLEIAKLFLPIHSNTGKNVLIYTTDAAQRSSMAIELYDFGHNPVSVMSEAEFKEKKENDFDVIVEMTYIGTFGQKIATKVRSNSIVYTISDYLDTDLSTNFNIEYHINSLNIGFKLFIFDASNVVGLNVQAIHFFMKLVNISAQYDAQVAICSLDLSKSPISFEDDLLTSGALLYKDVDSVFADEELTKMVSEVSEGVSPKRALNKVVIHELPGFIDSTAATLEMMTNAKAQKDSVDIQELVIDKKVDYLSASLGFFGELDGMVLLIFPNKIAKKACEILIGEKTDDQEMILDAVGELVNIIGGRIKTLLLDHNIDIDITLPRTYDNIDDIVESVKGRKGVQVNLTFENDSFTFFLTR